MKTLSEIISSQSIKSVSDYISLNKEIEKAINIEELSFSKSINIGLVSSFTINGIKETLRVKCAELNILAKF